jgi:hypothetical protein
MDKLIQVNKIEERFKIQFYYLLGSLTLKICLTFYADLIWCHGHFNHFDGVYLFSLLLVAAGFERLRQLSSVPSFWLSEFATCAPKNCHYMQHHLPFGKTPAARQSTESLGNVSTLPVTSYT